MIADYFVICSGDTERQIKAIVNEVLKRLDEEKTAPIHIEGIPASGWMILDYGRVIVHVFAPAERDYYRLEQLWRDATLVVRIQ